MFTHAQHTFTILSIVDTVSLASDIRLIGKMF